MTFQLDFWLTHISNWMEFRIASELRKYVRGLKRQQENWEKLIKSNIKA